MNQKRNIISLVLKSWYELLNGSISVPVYRIDAPPEETGNYVLLRAESMTDSTNGARHVYNPVIITEVVTKHPKRIDDTVAVGIDDEIAGLLFSHVNSNNLPIQDGIQVVDVRRENQQYLPEDDGVNRYHRIITRNVHRVAQLDLTT